MMNHLAAEGQRGGLGDLARMSQWPEACRMVAYGISQPKQRQRARSVVRGDPDRSQSHFVV
jgi:hypothetical protein